MSGDKMIKPMLCSNVKDLSILDSKYKYIAEIKQDGERAIAIITDDSITLQRRSGKICTKQYPEIIEALKKFRELNKDKFTTITLDGELIIPDANGISNFQAIQKRFHVKSKEKIEIRSKSDPATYVVFDVINKEQLMNRKEFLHKLEFPKHRLILSTYTRDLHTLFDKTKVVKAEGIVLKVVDSYYVHGRSKSWLKIKHKEEADLIFHTYEENNAGIKLIKTYSIDGDTLNVSYPLTVQCSGAQSEGVRQRIDAFGEVMVTVEYMSMTADRRLRMPVFKKLIARNAFKVIPKQKASKPKTISMDESPKTIIKEKNLRFVSGSSNKVYKLKIEEDDNGHYLTIEYGRYNGNLNSKTTSLEKGACEKEFNKKLKSKLKKGYYEE